MPSSDLGKVLIAIGIVILVAGLLLTLWPRLPFPGRLPGDLSFHRDGVHIFIPLATMIVVSIVLTIVINVVLRLFR